MYLTNIFDYAKAKADIERVRDKVDVLIVAMHWGQEYTHTPDSLQKELANYFSKLGVDPSLENIASFTGLFLP